MNGIANPASAEPAQVPNPAPAEATPAAPEAPAAPAEATPSAQPNASEGSILAGGNNNTGLIMGDAVPPPAGPKTPPAPEAAAPKGETPPAEVVGLAPLPDNATDDQKREFNNKLRALAGVPNAPKEYGNFGLGDDVKIDTEGEEYAYYTEVFHEIGLNTPQAKKLLEAHHKWSVEQVEHFQKKNDAEIAEYRNYVKSEFVKSLGGEAKYNEFRDVAVRGFKASAQGANLTNKEMEGLLNVVGDDPRFVKLFNGVGKLFREDVLISGAAPSAPEPSVDDIIHNLFNNKSGG